MDQVTREQKLFVAAAASGLFIVSLFFDWASVPSVDTVVGEVDVGFGGSGFDILPAAWIYLILAAVAALAFLADALNYELPSGIPAIPLGTWLISIPFVLSFAYMIDFPGGGPIDRGIGLWLGLVFSAIALVVAAWAWYEDREYA
jgi:hypothetical protein